MTDILLISAIIILIFLAARSIVKHRGKCSCGCDSCSSHCFKKKNNEKERH